MSIPVEVDLALARVTIGAHSVALHRTGQPAVFRLDDGTTVRLLGFAERNALVAEARAAAQAGARLLHDLRALALTGSPSAEHDAVLLALAGGAVIAPAFERCAAAAGLAEVDPAGLPAIEVDLLAMARVRPPESGAAAGWQRFVFAPALDFECLVDEMVQRLLARSAPDPDGVIDEFDGAPARLDPTTGSRSTPFERHFETPPTAQQSAAWPAGGLGASITRDPSAPAGAAGDLTSQAQGGTPAASPWQAAHASHRHGSTPFAAQPATDTRGQTRARTALPDAEQGTAHSGSSGQRIGRVSPAKPIRAATEVIAPSAVRARWQLGTARSPAIAAEWTARGPAHNASSKPAPWPEADGSLTPSIAGTGFLTTSAWPAMNEPGVLTPSSVANRATAVGSRATVRVETLPLTGLAESPGWLEQIAQALADECDWRGVAP